MRASLKSLVEGTSKSAVAAGVTTEPVSAPDHPHRNYRTAQTRADTRQVSGHFKPDVAQTLRLIAAEEGQTFRKF